jgi:hypothetical protein
VCDGESEDYPITAKITSSGVEHTDLKASNLALITNVDIETGCIWQQNSTVKHITFKKLPFWPCRNYIRYNTTEQGTHHRRAAGKSKKIFRLVFFICLLPNGLIILI